MMRIKSVKRTVLVNRAVRTAALIDGKTWNCDEFGFSQLTQYSAESAPGNSVVY